MAQCQYQRSNYRFRVHDIHMRKVRFKVRSFHTSAFFFVIFSRVFQPATYEHYLFNLSTMSETLPAPSKEISWFQEFVSGKLEKVKPILLEKMPPGI